MFPCRSRIRADGLVRRARYACSSSVSSTSPSVSASSSSSPPICAKSSWTEALTPELHEVCRESMLRLDVRLAGDMAGVVACDVAVDERLWIDDPDESSG